MFEHESAAHQERRQESQRLIAALRRGRISRRDFVVRAAILGFSGAAINVFLVACRSGSSTPTPVASTAPNPTRGFDDRRQHRSRGEHRAGDAPRSRRDQYGDARRDSEHCRHGDPPRHGGDRHAGRRWRADRDSDGTGDAPRRRSAAERPTRRQTGVTLPLLRTRPPGSGAGDRCTGSTIHPQLLGWSCHRPISSPSRNRPMRRSMIFPPMG